MGKKKKIPDLIEYLSSQACKNQMSIEYPYNETDAVILSSLCYIEFERINVGTGDDCALTIGAYAKLFQTTKAYRQLLATPIQLHLNQVRLVKKMAFNHRYSNLIIRNIVNESDSKKVIQFTAMTVELPYCGSGIEKVMVFRGTNESFHGWYEDILFAYAESETAGQKMAKDYLNLIGEVDTIHLTGHSKGGHLAEYAGVFCNKDIRAKIVSIINLDGPGIRRDLKEKYREGWKSLSGQLDGRWYSILPPSSVVGTSLSDPEYLKLVDSNGKGLMQHDLFTWKFNDGGIVISHKELDSVSKYLNQALKDAMEQVPAEEILQAFDPEYAQEEDVLKQDRRAALRAINGALQYAMAKNLGILFDRKMEKSEALYWEEAKDKND